MDFREAVIAHFQCKEVQARPFGSGHLWVPLSDAGICMTLGNLDEMPAPPFEFRLAPRTVMCNGVEVPAPESVAPQKRMCYLAPSPTKPDGYNILEWKDSEHDKWLLENGLVYLDMDACIARTKAMRITS